ncbi:MAG TPA: tryptophan--tRNA ligase [Firmicutes bacterium]|nr:tryptophan--tRNA ligase [Bacillota bacterium]
MAKALSGIKPTGGLTIGNYLGALRHFKNYQEDNELFIFVADMHALTLPIDPDYLKKNIYDIVALYLAAGLDPKKTVLFRQSDINEVGQLNSIIANYIYMGELSRMTQFKEKSRALNNKEIGVGLFTYPVLMSADLLLYDTEVCPVGEDQVQHVELARDIAKRINSRYKKKIFNIPHAVVSGVGKRIKNLQDPTKKMSKSDERGSKGVIYLIEDDEKSIRKKIMSAVTDLGTEVKYDEKNKPGISNLIQIYCTFTNKTIEEAEKIFADSNYGNFKKCVADAVLNELLPFKAKYEEYRSNMDYLNSVLLDGAERARKIAEVVLKRVRSTVGLI